MKYVVIAVTAMIAGLVQGIAGFGSGPIQMMTYPMLFVLSTAAAISVCASIPLNADMVCTYRHEIRWKKVLLPIVPYMAICSAAISYSRLIDQALMKKIFGVFLILLAVYYLFFNHSERKPLNGPKTVVFIVVSALCDAFFGIGGPLMVLYYLNKTDSTREYLGTIAAFFLLNGVYNTAYRFICGILTARQLPFIAIGVIFILGGVTIAHKLVNRMNDTVLRKTTYVMIGISGILNLFA